MHKNSLEVIGRDAEDGDINFMVQGVLSADLLNTVSKKYAEEKPRVNKWRSKKEVGERLIELS